MPNITASLVLLNKITEPGLYSLYNLNLTFHYRNTTQHNQPQFSSVSVVAEQCSHNQNNSSVTVTHYFKILHFPWKYWYIDHSISSSSLQKVTFRFSSDLAGSAFPWDRSTAQDASCDLISWHNVCSPSTDSERPVMVLNNNQTPFISEPPAAGSSSSSSSYSSEN